MPSHLHYGEIWCGTTRPNFTALKNEIFLFWVLCHPRTVIQSKKLMPNCCVSCCVNVSLICLMRHEITFKLSMWSNILSHNRGEREKKKSESGSYHFEWNEMKRERIVEPKQTSTQMKYNYLIGFTALWSSTNETFQIGSSAFFLGGLSRSTN